VNLEAILSAVVVTNDEINTITEVAAELSGSGTTNLVMMAMDNN
jgi:hypothetical protein